MSRPNPIRKIMESELPSLTNQRKQLFRPRAKDVDYCYEILNRYIFDNKLTRPKITLTQMRGAWGECEGHDFIQSTGSWCSIRISDKWYCPQWFLNTLAHEMVHQYQFDVYQWEYLEYTGKKMSVNSGWHGPSFFMWREQFQVYGLTLKISHCTDRWFAYQDLAK